MDCILIYNEMQAFEMFYFSNKFYLQQFQQQQELYSVFSSSISYLL